MIRFDVLKIENRSTGVATTNSEDNLKVQLTQFTDEGVLLEIPGRSYSVGHNITVHLLVSTGVKKIEFDFSAKIIACDPVDKDRDQITLKLLQYEDEKYQSVIGLLQEVQKQMTKVFKSIRED